MDGLAGKLFGKSKKKLGTLTSKFEEKLDKKRTLSPTVEPVEKDIKVDGIRGMREEKEEKKEEKREEKEEKRGEKGEHLSLGQEEIEQAISRRGTIPTLQNHDSDAKVILKIYYSKENINTRCRFPPNARMPPVWENFIEVLQSKYYLVGGGGKTAYVKSITQSSLDKLKRAIAVRAGVKLHPDYVKDSVDEADFILMYGHYAYDVVSSSLRGDVIDKPFTILSYHSMNIGKFGGLTYTNVVGKMNRVTNKAGTVTQFGAVAGHSVEFISYVFPYLMGKAVGIEPTAPRFVEAVAEAYHLNNVAIDYVSVLNSITDFPNTLSSYLKLDFDVSHESRSFEEDEDFPSSNFESRKITGKPGIFSNSDEIILVDKLAGEIDLLGNFNKKNDIDTAQQIIDIIYPTEERYEAAGKITMVVNIETFKTYIASKLDPSGRSDTFLRGLLNIEFNVTPGDSGPFKKARHGPSSDGANFLHGLRGGRKSKKKKKSKKSKKRNVKTRKK